MLEPIKQIEKAYMADRVSGSWLIVGRYGVGKKHLAEKICSLILNEDIKSPQTNFHPNIKWVDCGLTEESKKAIQKNILAGKEVDQNSNTYKRSITIDEIREGMRFLTFTSDTKWKILIVNRADLMNENAQNGLLKALEEPPQKSIILLLCENVGKLLPTIKSRCRMLKIAPLTVEKITSLLLKEYPDHPNIDMVGKLSEGSMGIAQDIIEYDGLSMYEEMISLLNNSTFSGVHQLRSFVDKVSGDLHKYHLVQIFLLDWLTEYIKKQALVNPYLSEKWLNLYQEINALYVKKDRVNLDQKQVLSLSILKIIEALHDR